MKKSLISLFMIIVPLCVFAQEDAKTCKEAVLPFLPPFEGYYLSDNCKFSEFFNFDFYVNGGVPTKKEGGYRETWYKRKSDNSRHISGPQILKQQSEVLKAIGGEEQPGSSGKVFKLNYQGKEFWIYVNANTYSEDLDNYGVISIEGAGSQQQAGSQSTKGTLVTTGIPGPQGLQEPTGTQNVSGNTVMTLIPAQTTRDTSHFSGLSLPPGVLESVLPARYRLTQGAPGSANQQTPTSASMDYPVHSIGEHYGGGIVFYVYDNGHHGLIAATNDVGGSEIMWIPSIHIGIMYLPAANGNGIGAGRLNTAIIIGIVGRGERDREYQTYAAYLCNAWAAMDDNEKVLYGDWYLPSLWELYLLYCQKNIVGGFSSAYYWSSTQASNGNLNLAWVLSFLTGEPALEGAGWYHPVRPIRSF